MYKLAALDIDGTISIEKNIVSDRVIEAIHRLDKKGIPVCICTGRNVASTMPIIETLNIHKPFTTVDGILTYCPKQNKTLYNNKLSEEIMRGIADIISSQPVYLEAITNNRYHKYIKNAEEYDYGLGKLNPIAKYAESLDEIMAVIPEVIEFIIGGEQKYVERCKAMIAQKYGTAVGLRDNLWEGYVFVGPPKSGKAAGIRQLCAHYGISLEEVVAIGDDLNDLDMLAEVGMGVAMGNAVERAKEAANYVTDTIENDGVALALNKFFS